jgi:hypothetical protein
VTRRDDLARIAYREAARCSLSSGVIPPQWDDLQPGQRQMYEQIAAAVARAERERIREAVEGLSAVCSGPDHVRAVPVEAVLELLEGP